MALLAPPPPPRRVPRWVYAHRVPLLPFAVGLALLLGGFLLWPRERPLPPAGTVPAVWATDVAGHPLGSVRLGAQVPSKPFEGQKTPPCEPRLEVPISGGCWVVLEAKPAPTCPPGAYQSSGKCVLPVKRADRPPTSLER